MNAEFYVLADSNIRIIENIFVALALKNRAVLHRKVPYDHAPEYIGLARGRGTRAVPPNPPLFHVLKCFPDNLKKVVLLCLVPGSSKFLSTPLSAHLGHVTYIIFLSVFPWRLASHTYIRIWLVPVG